VPHLDDRIAIANADGDPPVPVPADLFADRHPD
jgi:hypothetical protein